MMKRTVQFEINESDFPLLFKMDPNELNAVCHDILKRGYQSKFPNHDLIEGNAIMMNMIHHTDSIKNDIKEIDKKIDTSEIDRKLNQFSGILEQMFGITNNSSKKGKITEDMIYIMLRNKFKDFAIEETRGSAHSGDAIIHIPKNDKVVKVITEIKNYSNIVDTEEIDKLRYDMKYNKIKYSIFVSIRSGFVGKKQMAIEEFKHDNDIYTIIYVPNLFDDINKMEASVVLIDKLIDYHISQKHELVSLKWLENSIVSHLTKLDLLYTEYNNLKNSYFKMERTIKQAINDHYSSVISYEHTLKQKINDTWSSVNKDFGQAEIELIASQKSDIINKLKSTPGNKNLILVIQTLMRHDMYVQDSGVSKLWHIMNSKNDSMCGTIVRSTKEIHISFQLPKIKIDVDANKKIDDDLMVLDNMLS